MYNGGRDYLLQNGLSKTNDILTSFAYGKDCEKSVTSNQSNRIKNETSCRMR